MMFRWIVKSLFLIVFLCFSAPLLADDTNTFLQEFCKEKPDQELKNIFPKPYEESIKIRAEICLDPYNILSTEKMLKVVSLLNGLETIFNRPEAGNTLKEPEVTRVLTTKLLSTFEVRGGRRGVPLTLSMIETNVDILDEDKQSCDAFFARFQAIDDCASGLKLFSDLYGYAQKSFSQPFIVKSIQDLNKIERKWEDFYKRSRSQTLLEMAYNGKQFQDDNSVDGFAGPPDSQTILLHPSIVIENVNDAVDGQQEKEAILLELWGKNYWENEGIVPSGYSFGVLLADRAERDYAFGVALHFENTMTLGFSFRHNDSEEAGVFITYDLLKGLQDKKQTINAYRKKFEQ